MTDEAIDMSREKLVGLPMTITRLTNTKLTGLLASSLVHSVAGVRLVDGDLLLVANNRGKDTVYDGTIAVRLSSAGELRWATTFEEPKGAGQEPKLPVPWRSPMTGDRNRILPTPDRGALLVGRPYKFDRPAAVKLDEAGKIVWSAVAELGFDGDFEHPPVWFIDAEHVAVLLRNNFHDGGASSRPPYGFASFDARTGSRLASAGIGELHGSADVATFMPDGRILYAEACGNRLSLTAFDAQGRWLERHEIPEMGWNQLAAFDYIHDLASPALALRDGGVILVGQSGHFIRFDSALHLTAHHAGRNANERYHGLYFRETPAGNLIGESPLWGGTCARWSADGSLWEGLGGWEQDRGHVLDSWLEADGAQLRGLTRDGRILALPLGRDPENPVSSLATRLVHGRREGSMVTVPLGAGPGRPLPVSAPGGKGPLDRRRYERATAVELGRLLGETTAGAWRSTETYDCAVPAYATDNGHIIAIVGTSSKQVRGPRKHLLEVDTHARTVAWTALDSWIVLAGQRDVVSDWSLANQPDEGLVLHARLATPTVEVSFLDLGLRAVSGFTVAVGSLYHVARPVLVMPDGSAVLALNERISSDVRLERWRQDGSLQWRRDHAGKGPVLSLGLHGDGSVALAGPEGFWVVGADDGALVGDRRVRLLGPEVRQWTLTSDGVLTAERNGLVRHPLRGEPTTIVLVPELGEMHFASASENLVPPPQLAVLADGGVVLSDVAVTSHDVYGGRGRDETYVARLRRLDAQGRLLWTETTGEAETWREWFWSDSGGSQNPIGIGPFGIVRKRYRGGTAVDGLVVLPNGVVIATLVGVTTGLCAIGPDGRVAWLRREKGLWSTRPNRPFALPDGGFVVASKGPRLGLFDANGKNRGWTGAPEKAAADDLLYAGATLIRGDRIALVRVRE
jgi:hypothetical protein